MQLTDLYEEQCFKRRSHLKKTNRESQARRTKQEIFGDKLHYNSHV